MLRNSPLTKMPRSVWQRLRGRAIEEQCLFIAFPCVSRTKSETPCFLCVHKQRRVYLTPRVISKRCGLIRGNQNVYIPTTSIPLYHTTALEIKQTSHTSIIPGNLTHCLGDDGDDVLRGYDIDLDRRLAAERRADEACVGARMHNAKSKNGSRQGARRRSGRCAGSSSAIALPRRPPL